MLREHKKQLILKAARREKLDPDGDVLVYKGKPYWVHLSNESVVAIDTDILPAEVVKKGFADFS